MLTNNFQAISSESYIGVPTANNAPTAQVGQPPTSYDYLALLPAILTALTPLVLGLKKKHKYSEDEE